MAFYKCPKAQPKTGIYGAEWDGSSSTQWVRTDDAAAFPEPVAAAGTSSGSSPFDSIMPWSGMQKVTDAAAGSLVSIPKYYYKWTRTGAAMKLQISNEPHTGFFVSPAHADRGDGVGERAIVYVGAYNCADNTYKSLSGIVPSGNYNMPTYRSGIHNLGSDIWNFDYAMYWTIAMLYLVEYANWDSQSTIGNGSHSSIEATGMCDSMRYHTGNKSGHVRYRYIEDLWSNTYVLVDGIFYNQANVYCIKNPADFGNTSKGVFVGAKADGQGVTASWTEPNASGFEYALVPNSLVTDSNYSSYSADVAQNYNSNTQYHNWRLGGMYGSSNRMYGLFCYLCSSYDTQVSVFSRGRVMKLP